jgi:superfamily I DNA/RNA helicase
MTGLNNTWFSDFPGAKIIRLERNYRSTGHILGVAAGLISHNQGRLGKTLFTDGELGEKPTVTGVWDSEEEARVIATRSSKFSATSDNTTAVRGFIRRKPSRKPFPAHLPRERVIVPGPTACACCGSTRLAKLGET